MEDDDNGDSGGVALGTDGVESESEEEEREEVVLGSRVLQPGETVAAQIERRRREISAAAETPLDQAIRRLKLRESSFWRLAYLGEDGD